MSQAQALAEARELKAIVDRWWTRTTCSIELLPGRGSDPWAVPQKPLRMHHHTGAPYRGTGGNKTPALGTCKNGRPQDNLPGPLCNGYGGFDLRYRIICMGLANHPGLGGPIVIDGVRIPKDSARGPTWGTEWEGGLQDYETIPGMLDFMAAVDCALAEYGMLGAARPLTSQMEHSTWAPTRKVDRRHFTRTRGIALTTNWFNGHRPGPTPPPTLRGNLMSLTFYFGVRGDSKRPTRLWDGGVVVDRPAQLVPRLDQLFDKQYQKNTGRTVGSTKPEDIIPREYTSPDLYDWLVEVGQSHRDDAPGWFARSNLDGAEYFILASGAGRYGKGRVFDLHKFTMAVAKFDTTPLPLDQDMLDEIPLIAGASS